MPRAAPRAIADLVSQFSGVLPPPLLPVEDTVQKRKVKNQMYRLLYRTTMSTSESSNNEKQLSK